MTVKKVYVGNLPYSINSGSLGELFSSFGEVVSSSVVSDRATGRSRGFGFVEMAGDSADQAIAEMNGKTVDGRDLVVNEARPKEESSGGGFRGGDRPRRDRY